MKISKVVLLAAGLVYLFSLSPEMFFPMIRL